MLSATEVDRLQRVSLMRRRRFERRGRGWYQSLWFARAIVQLCQPGPERILHLACICSTQGVLSRKSAASPYGRALNRVNLVELVQQLIAQDS